MPQSLEQLIQLSGKWADTSPHPWMWMDESNQVHMKSLDSEAQLQLPKQRQALDMIVKEAREIKARHARASTNALHSDPKLLVVFLVEIVNFMQRQGVLEPLLFSTSLMSPTHTYMSVTRNSGKVNFVKQPRDTPLNPNSVHELWTRLFTLITQVDSGADGAAREEVTSSRDSTATADEQAGAKAKVDSEPQSAVVLSSGSGKDDGRSSEEDPDVHLRRFTGSAQQTYRTGRKSIVQTELKGTREWDEASLFITQGVYAQTNSVLLKIFVDNPSTHLDEEFARHKISLRVEGGATNVITALSFVQSLVVKGMRRTLAQVERIPGPWDDAREKHWSAVHQFWQVHLCHPNNVRRAHVRCSERTIDFA